MLQGKQNDAGPNSREASTKGLEQKAKSKGVIKHRSEVWVN